MFATFCLEKEAYPFFSGYASSGHNHRVVQRDCRFRHILNAKPNEIDRLYRGDQCHGKSRRITRYVLGRSGIAINLYI